MSIKDVLTSDMMTRVTAVSATDMILAIIFSFLIGLFIFYVYKKSYNGILYSASFGLSLIALCMIASILILAVSSNIVLSLGMVGALSIVRFRTAIKEPMDIVFLFWAMSAGIILATGMIPLAVFGSLAIGIVIITFANKDSKYNPYMLIVRAKSSSLDATIMDIIKADTDKNRIKGKTINNDGSMELSVEVQLKDDESSFVQRISAIDGVENVVMVSYNGDYMS